jgi:hypothetical protein
VLPDSIHPDFNDVDVNAELSIKWTFCGMTIVSRAVFESAFDSICFNDDDDSNEIDESDLQNAKHDEQRISTEHGITIDSSVEFENASDAIILTNPGIIMSFGILKQQISLLSAILIIK